MIRRGVELVLQALIEVEATDAIGVERYERSDSPTNQRDGARGRLLTTKAGDVELPIPKLPWGSFSPSILERRRRIDRALFAVVMEAYRPRGLDSRGRRSGDGAGSGLSHFQVPGQPHLYRPDAEMAALGSARAGAVAEQFERIVALSSVSPWAQRADGGR